MTADTGGAKISFKCLSSINNWSIAHRAILNTYISMTASTVMSLVTAALYGDNGKLDPVDLQNASLSGGVVVGAVANLMIQPYGAIICGTVIGVISTLGFEVVQVS